MPFRKLLTKTVSNSFKRTFAGHVRSAHWSIMSDWKFQSANVADVDDATHVHSW